MIYISDALVATLPEGDQPLTHARIGYHNIAFGKTPTASSAAVGFPAIAASYETTFEFWRPVGLPATWAIDNTTPVECDYAGVVGSIIGCTIRVQSSDDGVVWTTHMEAAAEYRVAMLLFPRVTAQYWRVVFDTVNPDVAVIYIGKALAMQRAIYQGHSPLTLSRVTELSNNISQGGQYLGRSVERMGNECDASWSHLKAAWYRENFDPFVIAAQTKPFFFAWRPLSFPKEVGYMWTGGDIKPVNSGPRDFMSVSLPMSGIGVE